jgi:hypothetical protein
MRSEDDVREVFRLADAGHSRAAIARRVGIARATVRVWLEIGQVTLLARRTRIRHSGDGRGDCQFTESLHEPAFAYLLGQYLGDGCISRTRSSWRLRITCCDSYPAILEECAASIRRVKEGARVGLLQREGCIEVRSDWLHWPCLLPHGEGGPKHLRSIELADSQRWIAIDRCPGQFIRGLIHSDGWRGLNRVRGANGLPYAYPRYQFSNRSEDIKQLFIEACGQLGVETRRMNGMTISVAKPSVARLDEFVGPKQ